MPSTTQCPQCGVVLAVPPGSAGRRMRCPRCGTRFRDGRDDGLPPDRSPADEAGHPSSTVFPAVASPDPALPAAAGSLRETFGMASLHGGSASTAPPQAMADASALMRDPGPSRRRPISAEARARSRCCPGCRATVPVGMATCSSCDLDLETGQPAVAVIGLDEAPEPRRPVMPPIGIALVGGTALLASLVLALAALLQWRHGRLGAELLGALCLFGAYAAAQLLRGRSARLLLGYAGLSVYLCSPQVRRHLRHRASVPQ